MFEQFKARAEAVSAEVHRCATRGEAMDWVIDFLRQEGVADRSAAIRSLGRLSHGRRLRTATA